MAKFRDNFRPTGFTADDELRCFGIAPDTHLKSTIRILVWNILKAKRRTWEADFTELVHDRDLVVLQEAVSDAPSDGLFAEGTRHEWIMARSHKHPITGICTGVKTGCVAKASDSHFYLSQAKEPVVKTQKLLLVTYYPLGSGVEQLLVLNMHAINFVSAKKYIEQLDQLKAALSYHDGPVILAGDFNTWNPKRLGLFQTVSQAAGLAEATMERRVKLTQLNQHLDHVFYRGLTLRRIQSLSHIKSSDHAPITATFDWSTS